MSANLISGNTRKLGGFSRLQSIFALKDHGKPFFFAAPRAERQKAQDGA